MEYYDVVKRPWRFAISGEWAQAMMRHKKEESNESDRLVRLAAATPWKNKEADPNGETTEPIDAPGMLRVPTCSVHIFERKRKADSASDF